MLYAYTNRTVILRLPQQSISFPILSEKKSLYQHELFYCMNQQQHNCHHSSKNKLALFANEFALNGKIDLKNAREWMIFLFLVAQLNPKTDQHLSEKDVPIIQLKTMLEKNGKRSGSLYNDIKRACRRMVKAICEFDSNVFIHEKPLPIYLPIFQKISPKRTKDGLFISFKFNEEMKPLLLGFKQNFVSIELPSTMTSAYAIRFLLYAKAQRDRRRKRDGQISQLKFEVDQLKALLKLEGQYPRFNNFKTRVIETIIQGINQGHTLRIIKTDYKKSSRNVKEIIFHVTDAKVSKKVSRPASNKPDLNKPDLSGTSIPKDVLHQLTHAQLKAFHFLVKKGIYKGIAVRKILHRMPSSVCDGYEDYFCEEVYQIVSEKSIAKDDKGRAAVLVDWFMKDIFKHHYFSRIIENVHERKKQLSQEQRDNRAMAKGMSDQAFRVAYRKMVPNDH